MAGAFRPYGSLTAQSRQRLAIMGNISSQRGNASRAPNRQGLTKKESQLANITAVPQ
jgi:hypothetical protein